MKIIERINFIWVVLMILVVWGRPGYSESNLIGDLSSKCNSESKIIQNLVEAASVGDECSVLTLLSKDDVDLRAFGEKNSKYSYETALTGAARYGHEGVVSLLLSKFNADVDVRDDFDMTALMNAARYGHTNVVSLLIKSGAEVNAKTDRGYSPFIYASVGGHPDIMSLLLSKGAQADEICCFGVFRSGTALSKVARIGDKDIALLLINEGADIDGRGRQTPLIEAVGQNNQDMISFLIKQGANLEALDGHGFTALMSAALYNKVNMASFLLEQGANVNTVSSVTGGTAFSIAALWGQLEVASLFLAHGAGMSSNYPDGMTPLMLLTFSPLNRPVELASLLIKKGADLDVQNKMNLTALMLAVTYNRLNLVSLFINKGAGLNIQTHDGFTALMAGSLSGRKEAVSLLIEGGADLNIRTHEGGFTALMIASLVGHKDIVSLLVEKGADGSVKNNCNETYQNLSQVFSDCSKALSKKMGIINVLN